MTPPATAALQAAYLHTRAPASARIAFRSSSAIDVDQLPEALRPKAERVDVQVLLPVEESSL